DVTPEDLLDWLEPLARPVAVIDTTSCSGPFLGKLTAPGRVVITATKNGKENNFAYFGRALGEVLGDPQTDLDDDQQISLLELYLAASARLAQFYTKERRMVTEHALLDDNGDSFGTPPDWFQGIRAVKKAQDFAEADGHRAHQLCLAPSAV